MSSFNWSPIASGSGSSGVSSLNSLTGALTLTAGSGITITPSGGDTLTIAATGGAGTWNATKIASSDSHAQNSFGTFPSIYGDSTLATNYVLSTTDVPLLNTTNPGAWLALVASDVLEPTSIRDGGGLYLQAGLAAGTGYGGEISILAGAGNDGGGGNVFINAGGVDSGTGDAGSITLTAGGNSGSGDGGSITLAIGGGTPDGKILLQPKASGPQSVIGQVWTATDVNGEGDWASLTAANVTLSNLTSPTAVNQALIPDGSFDLGSGAAPWNSIYAVGIFSSTNADLGIQADSNLSLVASAATLTLNAGSSLSATSTTNLSLTSGDAFTVKLTAGDGVITVSDTSMDFATADSIGEISFDCGFIDFFGDGSATTIVRFYDLTGTYVGLQAPNVVGGNISFKLPAADTALAGRPLISDGAGNLSFSVGASGSFTTVDLKTVTVVAGIITAIV